MSALPSFPHTEVKAVASWANFHGTISGRRIPVYCTPDVIPDAGGAATRRLRRHGEAMQAIVAHCVAASPAKRLRVMGSRWSMSRVIEPSDVVLDPANFNVMLRLQDEWLSAGYRSARSPSGFAPILIQGGAKISSINRRLAETGLALQTSGAGDGHRLAGAIATGTHGAAVKIGAIHDTVLGMHLVVAADRSLFIQPATGSALRDDIAAWLQSETGIPTTSMRDDDLFGAALVSLGSLGIAHAAVVEARPIYRLRRRVLARKWADAQLWEVIRTLRTKPLHPTLNQGAFHVEVVLDPYPHKDRMGAYVQLMWVVNAGGASPVSPLPAVPDSAELMGLLATLGRILDDVPSGRLLERLIGGEIAKRFVEGDRPTAFPGQVFGPTSLPPGQGISTEIVVDHRHTEAAVDAIYGALAAEAKKGRHLLGAVALRFVPQTRALLGMNIHKMNCFIEMVSIRNDEIPHLYAACFDALEDAGIPFTCHWGQMHGLTPARLDTYFGDRVARWKQARATLLPSSAARRVFACPLLAEVGLG